MFSITTDKVTSDDLKAAVDNVRSTRPFEVVRCGSDINLKVEPGYQGINILKNSFFFPNVVFDLNVHLQAGDRIILFAQNDPVQNGIWSVVSIFAGYVNIQRPIDYAYNTPIRPGQFLIVIEGYYLGGAIIKNTTPEFDSNQNKINSYNGISAQYWTPYAYVNYVTSYTV
jgi:hypothetical protein